MITNNEGLPNAIIRAIKNDTYSDGGSDISVTRLISPPQQVRLRKENGSSDEDASNMIFALFGQAFHLVLEKAKRDTDITEERYTSMFKGKSLSAQIDQYDTLTKTLVDWKTSSRYSVTLAKEGKETDKWEQQLNVQAHLMRANGISPEKLMICAFVRDWRAGESLRADYPKKVEVFEFPLWDNDKCETFIKERMAEHFAEKVRDCTDSERWKKDTVFAVHKKGRRSAVKLFKKEDEAKILATEKGSTHYVEKREGVYTRCLSYCNVSEFCPQNNNQL